jgi:hypothetical protein
MAAAPGTQLPFLSSHSRPYRSPSFTVNFHADHITVLLSYFYATLTAEIMTGNHP